MRILLLGEYSNVHWTLAEGLRVIGHEVTVVSDGDGWKNYPRDVDLKRQSLGILDTAKYLYRINRIMPKLRGYDIVQIINPIFFDLKAERMMGYYSQIRKHNKKMIMAAFGMDHYWVKAGMDCTTFRYSDFNIGPALRKTAQNDAFIADWLYGEKGRLNQFIAKDCDAIVSGLYEYDVCYRPYFAAKLHFIPFPIKLEQNLAVSTETPTKIRFFIGVQTTRNEYKGTDIMLRALQRLKADFPDEVEINIAESVPFNTYKNMMNESDVLLDQLYSYTPAMNGLHAMSKGLVLVGGGEPEQYNIIDENVLRPIVNVTPNEQDVYLQLKNLIENKHHIPTLKKQSIEYVSKHHEYQKVAKQYIKLYNNLLSS